MALFGKLYIPFDDGNGLTATAQALMQGQYFRGQLLVILALVLAVVPEPFPIADHGL